MESLDWTAKVNTKGGGGKKKGKHELDSMMDDYDEVMTEMAGRKGANCRDLHKSPMFWPEDKLMFMKELSWYRNLYVEMAKLLKATKKTFHKRAKEFSKKEKSFQEQAQAFMKKESQFVEKDNIITQKEKMFRDELVAREEACRQETEAIRIHMEEMMAAKANNFTKAIDVQSQEFQHREKHSKKKLDAKLEAKEAHFTKVVDGLQGSFESLKRSVVEANEKCALVTRERDEARNECKRFQSEMYIAMDERIKAEARIEELTQQNAALETERQRLSVENARLGGELHVTTAEMRKESTQNTWNTARIQELEEAVEDIWDAQNLRAELDNQSINQYYEDLRNTTRDLQTTQSQLAGLSVNLNEREEDVDKQRRLIELQQKELHHQKHSIATLNDLIRRLSTRAGVVRRPVANA